MNFGLTDRQLEILRQVGLCDNVKSIAPELHISAKTVEYHIAKIKEKIQCNTKEEMVRFCLEKGIVKEGERKVTTTQLPVIVTPEREISNSNDLVEALLEAASRAASGNANVLQVNALCQAANTLISFARLQMDVLAKSGGRLPKWLLSGSIEINGKKNEK